MREQEICALAAWLLDHHLFGRNLEGQLHAVGQAFYIRKKHLQNVGGLKVLGLGVGVGVIDEAGDGRLAGTHKTDIEEGKVFLGLDGMPLDIAKGEARMDYAIRQGRDAYVESAAMVDAEIKPAGEKMRGLHEKSAAGETGIAVEAGGDTVALHQPGGEDLRVGGIGHGCSLQGCGL